LILGGIAAVYVGAQERKLGISERRNDWSSSASMPTG